VAFLFAALTACDDGRNLHKVYPVKGKILVNGQPAAESRSP